MVTKSFLKNTWHISFPVILTNLIQTSILIIDTLMIGRLGPEAIAAVGMGNIIRLLVLITILSVSGGAMSMMAQAKGGRDPIRMSFVTRQSLIAGLLLSIFIGISGILVTPPLLTFMNSGGDSIIVNIGTDYLNIIFLGTPFIVLNFTSNRLMQGAGDTTTPFVLTILLFIFNVLFNYIFIFGYGPIPAYGVMGAAIGTILARGLLAFASIGIFYSGRNVVKILKGSWTPHLQMIKDILSIGVPSGIQGLFRHGSNVIVMALVTTTSLGSYGAAALAICTQIESIASQTAVGLNVAATTLVGQELGKWQPNAAYRKGTFLIYIGFFMMLLLVFPMVYFAEELILLFDPSANSEILKGGISYLHTNTLFLPVSAFGILITGTLRGAGDTRPAMVSAIIGRNLTAIILAYVFAFPMGLDYVGIWYGIISGRIVSSLILWIVWRRKKWQYIALRKTAIYRQHLFKLSRKTLVRFLNQVRTPQMALEGTIEVVNRTDVTYKGADRSARVTFKDDEYYLTN